MAILHFLLYFVTAKKNFLDAIYELETPVGGPCDYEINFICNPTTCPRSLKCVGQEECCKEGDWGCCGVGKEGLKKREFCPSESLWNVMCEDGTCEQNAEDCGTHGGVRYAGRSCSCNPTKCQHGITCVDGTCCNKGDWDCCGKGDAKYKKRLFCPIGQIMCNDGYCVDANDKCDSKGGIRFPKEACSLHHGHPCNFATCEGGMTCFDKKASRFTCCKEGDLDCCEDKNSRLFCPKGLAMCMDFQCLETNEGCDDASAGHGGVRYSNVMCPGGLEMVELEESTAEQDLKWDDEWHEKRSAFGLESLAIVVGIIIFLIVVQRKVTLILQNRRVMDQRKPLIR